jgi:hypothetical protein
LPLAGEGKMRGIGNPVITTLTPAFSPRGRGGKSLKRIYEMAPREFWIHYFAAFSISTSKSIFNSFEKN